MIPEISPVNNWSGNGEKVKFDFDFLIDEESQLKVYHINSRGEINLLEMGLDYSIHTNEPNSAGIDVDYSNGGYILFPLGNSTYSVLAEGETISLQLDIPFSQDSEYKNSSLLNLNNLEFSFDYLTRLCQILERQLKRALKFDEGKASYNTVVPNPEPYKTLRWNKDATALENELIRGIEDIEKTGTEGLVDTYTIFYNDNTTGTLTITNGEKGDKGDRGGRGETGADGAYVVDVSPVAQSEYDVTYRMTFSNGHTYDFPLVNGTGTLKWIPIKTTDWILKNGFYEYSFSASYSVAGVYKGTILTKDLVQNIDVNVSKTITTIKSLEAFDGFILAARIADDSVEALYTHTQITPAKIWTIEHNLNTKPTITVVDNNEKEVWCKKVYTDMNTVTCYFNILFSGKAYLNYTR